MSQPNRLPGAEDRCGCGKLLDCCGQCPSHGRETSADEAGLTRAALIDAAVRRIHATHGQTCVFGQNCPGADVVTQAATETVGTVLPLIADAIEDPIRLDESVHYEFCSLAQAGALVRSLGAGSEAAG